MNAADVVQQRVYQSLECSPEALKHLPRRKLSWHIPPRAEPLEPILLGLYYRRPLELVESFASSGLGLGDLE